MNRNRRIWSILAPAAILALAFIVAISGCAGSTGPGGGELTELDGVWESDSGKMVIISRSSFTGDYKTLTFKGNLAISENTLTVNVTHISANGGGSWKAYSQYVDEEARARGGLTAEQWNLTPEFGKNMLRRMVDVPDETLEGTFVLSGDKLTFTSLIISGNDVYYREGTRLPAALLGQWVYADDPATPVIEFTETHLIWEGITYNIKVTGKKVEIGTSAGSFPQVFCESYSIVNGELGFTGGLSASLSSVNKLVKNDGNTSASAIALIENRWNDNSITSSGGEVWYQFPVTAGTTYRVWWNDKYSGNATKTLDVRVSAKYSDDTPIFTGIDSGWNTAQYFTPVSNDTIHVRVYPYSPGSGTGTFGIAYSTGSSRPGIPDPGWVMPSSHTSLAENLWEMGTIDGAGNEAWYSFTLTGGTTYRIWWNDSYQGNHMKTLDVRASAWYANGIPVFDAVDSAYSSAQSFTPVSDDIVYIRVYPKTSDDTGTYGIVFSTGAVRPLALPSIISPLTEDEWINGNITAAVREEWYSFAVTSGSTYRVWWNDSSQGDYTKTVNVYAEAMYENGTSFFTDTNAGWSSPRTVTASSDGTVYVRVYTNVLAYAGSYGIVYSTGSIRPAVPFAPPSSVPLVDGVWDIGTITSASGGSAWYSFEAVSGSTYNIWWNDSNQGDDTKTLNVRVSAFYSDGTIIFNGIDYGWSHPQSFTAGSSGTVYVCVYPYSTANYGTYGIVYGIGSVRPGVPLNLPSSVPQLTANQWSNVIVDGSGSEEWYSFTAAEGTHRIWWNSRGEGDYTKTLNAKVSAYYDDGTPIFIGISNGWSTAQQFSVASSSTVYIRIYNYSSNSATFGIVYSVDSAARPTVPLELPSVITPLEENAWENGSIAILNGEEWYSLAATSGIMYRVWWNERGNDGTKTMNVRVSAYYSDGTMIFNGIDYGWSSPQSFTASSSGTVYFRVFPYNPGGSTSTGTYGIAYSTGSTRPPTE